MDASNFGNRAAVVGTTTSHRRDPGDLRRLDDTKRRRLEQRHRLYEPQTQETHAAYDALLHVFRHHLAGAQPLDDVLAAAALKDDGSPAETKKQEIEKLLNPISDEMFAELASIADRVTDFHHNDHDAAPAASSSSSSSHGASASSVSDVHAAVETTTMIPDDDDRRRAGPPAAARFHKQYEYRPNKMVIFGYDDNDYDENQMQLQDDDVVVVDDNDYGDLYHNDDESSQAPPIVDARDIDACWLQRKVCQAYYDASEEIVGSQQVHHDLAEEILRIMEKCNDDRDAENRLAALFDYDKFDLINLLLRNRLKIVWCTRLARAQHHEQKRKEIEEEMANDPTLARVLDQLRHAARASKEEKEEQKQQDSQDAQTQQ